MAKFKMQELVTEGGAFTSRLGTGSMVLYPNTEVGKAVKLGGDSAHVLCVAGDKIEGFVRAVEPATLDGFTVGTVQNRDRKAVVLDGLEATPGTGSIAIGDYVVAGTMVALATALASASSQKVCKATNQPGAAIGATLASADTAAAVDIVLDAALVKVADAQKNVMFGWRLVSASGSSVGSTGVIERVK